MPSNTVIDFEPVTAPGRRDGAIDFEPVIDFSPVAARAGAPAPIAEPTPASPSPAATGIQLRRQLLEMQPEADRASRAVEILGRPNQPETPRSMRLAQPAPLAPAAAYWQPPDQTIGQGIQQQLRDAGISTPTQQAAQREQSARLAAAEEMQRKEAAQRRAAGKDSPTVKKILQRAIIGVEQGVQGARDMAAGVAQLVADANLVKNAALSTYGVDVDLDEPSLLALVAEETSASSGRVKEKLAQQSRAVAGGPAADFAESVGQGAASIVPTVAVSFAGLGPAAVMAGIQTGGPTYLRAKAAYLADGASPGDATVKAGRDAFIAGQITGQLTRAFGATGVEALAAGIKPATVRGVLKGVLGEGAEEGLDELAQAIHQRVTYNPEITLEEAVGQSLHAAAVGGVLGGGVVTLGGAAAKLRDWINEQPAPQSAPLNSQPSAQQSSPEPAQTQGEAGMVGGGATPIQSFPEPAAPPVPTSLPPQQLPVATAILLDQREEGGPAPAVDTPPAPATVAEVGAETITGSNERRGSEMPAEVPAVALAAVTTPTPTAPAPTTSEAAPEDSLGVPAADQQPPPLPTSIKNATVARERAARWLPAATEAARRGFGEVWEDAGRRAAADPDAAAALVASLKDKPRAVEDWEDALLLRRQIELQRLHGETAARAIEMHESTDAGPERLAEREAALARAAQISDQLLELYDVNKAVGTATARGLAARRIMAFEDYSLAKLELDKRTANEGRPVTPEERAEIERLHQKVTELQRQLDEHTARREARQAEEASQEAVQELIEHAARQPDYDAKVLTLADRIVARLNERADAARVRLREKLMRASAGVDPTIIVDLAEIGAAKIAQGTVDFSRWSAEMVSEFGQGVAGFLEEAWKRANVSIDEAVGAATAGDQRRAPKVRRAVRKQDVEGWRESIIEGIREAVADGRELSGLGDFVRRLAESFVRGGIRQRDALIDAVHAVLRAEVDPNITRREAMDAISGYGSHKPLDKDAVKVALRDLKGQMQQLAKLEDIQAREPLKKTGVERRTPSDEERRLMKQVNEAKRRFGVVVTDPETQLKGALDAIKTRLRNQIADLTYQIKTRRKIVKTRTPAPFDAESRQLEAQRDALRAQFETLFPKAPMTEAQRAAAAERVLDRTIADLEARIKAGDPSPKARRAEVRTPRLDALRARRDELKAQLKELRDALNPKKTPEERALAAVKARMATSIAEYTERLARGDFSPRTKRKVALDARGLELQTQLAKIKADWQRGLIKDRLARRTFGQKLAAGVKEAINLPRVVLSSWDVSAVLRQGGFVSLGNPLRAIRNIGPMFKALASKDAALRSEQELLSRPNAPLYARAKLYLAPVETLQLSRMEEQMMSTMAEKVPGVSHSNRAYISFLNRLRADSFDAMLRSVQRPGVELTQLELEAIANYINIATGRGNLGRATAAAETLATIFFSPRLMVSRFQLIAGSPLYRGSWATRKAIAVEYAKFLGGVSVVLFLGALAGAEIEREPRSSDFSKLRFGNTRVDFLGGIQQPSVLLTRLIRGSTVTTTGKERAIRGADLPYGADSASDVIWRFLRSKLSPVVGAGVNVASGEDVVGQPVTAGSTAMGLLVPLTFQDIAEVMEEHGIARGTALGLLSLFGFGIQHFEARKPEGDKK